MITFAQKLRLCPACGYGHDRASTLGGGRGPEPGDLSICLSCGVLCQFDKDLEMRPAPPGILGLLKPMQRRMIELSQKHIRQRGPIPQTKQ